MQRYIRLKDGRLFDTTKLKTKSCVKEFKNIKYFFRDETIAYSIYNGKEFLLESDDVRHLMLPNDLCRVKELTDDYIFTKGHISLEELKNMTERNNIIDCLDNGNLELLELYTKQGNNYILVWTKEGGVI